MIQSILRFGKKEKQSEDRSGEQLFKLKQCLDTLHEIENFMCKNKEAKSERAAELLKLIYESSNSISILSNKAYYRYKY
ncbi:MAG: hypothetical protein RLN62_02565 [Rickettsiales bacterium]